MSNIHIQLHSFRQQVTFNDINHSYITNKNGIKNTSVTTLIKKFEEEFDTEYWTVYKVLEFKGNKVRKADQRRIHVNGRLYTLNQLYTLEPNIRIDAIRLASEWDYLAIRGCTRGSIIHNYLEQKWQGKIFPDIEWNHLIKSSEHKDFTNELIVLKQYADRFIAERPYLVPISLEQIVGDEELQIYGQIDAIFYNTLEGTYHIYDYKNDKDIEKENKFQNFSDPISDLQQCGYNKYCLQLSLYQYFLEKHTDIKIHSSYVVWVNPINSSYHLEQTIYYEQHIRRILQAHKASMGV